MKKTNIKKLTLSGLLLAAALILTSLESAFFSFLPAGIRIGLSNVAVMLALLTVSIPSALSITILKSFFVFLTRGFTAGALSLSGGLAAFLITAVLIRKTKASYVMISVSSAVMHTIGQLCAAAVILGSSSAFGYLPVMGITSVVSGVFTGIVLKTVLPAAEKAVKGAQNG